MVDLPMFSAKKSTIEDMKLPVEHFVQTVLGSGAKAAGADAPHFPEKQIVNAFYYIITTMGPQLESNPRISLREVLQTMGTQMGGPTIQSSTSNLKYCGGCGAPVSADTRFCAKCGRRQS